MKEGEVGQAVSICSRIYRNQTYRRRARSELTEMFSRNDFQRPIYLAATENGKVLGIAGYCVSGINWSITDVCWVMVDPQHQGKGIGLSLMRRMIKRIKGPMMLTAKKTNLYEKVGFRSIAFLPREARYLMIRKMNKLQSFT